jgi:hypothetical protein
MAIASDAGTVFVGSRLKAEAFGGMNGDPNASSLLPGQQVKRGSVGKSIMKGSEVSLEAANAANVQQRTISSAPTTPSPTMKSPDRAGDRVPSGGRASYAQLNNRVRTNAGKIEAFKS